jgi:hypothetical protein
MRETGVTYRSRVSETASALKSPAPTSSVIDSATCATSKPRPKRPSEPVVPGRARLSSTRTATDCHADTTPIARPITTVSSAVAASTPPASGRHRRKLFTRTTDQEGYARTARTIPHASGRAPANATVDSRSPVDQQLPEHAPRAAAECVTNRDLVAPGQRAREGEARKVGARDRQEHPHQARSTTSVVPYRCASPKSPTRAVPRPAADGAAPPARLQATWPAASPTESTATREQFRARRVDRHAARETSHHVRRSKRPGRGRRWPLASARRAR